MDRNLKVSLGFFGLAGVALAGAAAIPRGAELFNEYRNSSDVKAYNSTRYILNGLDRAINLYQGEDDLLLNDLTAARNSAEDRLEALTILPDVKAYNKFETNKELANHIALGVANGGFFAGMGIIWWSLRRAVGNSEKAETQDANRNTE